MNKEHERRHDPASRDEVKAIVSEAVRETLIQLGLDVTKPIEIQKDMLYLREVRKTTEEIKRRGIVYLLGLFLASLIGLAAAGFYSKHS